MLGHYFLHVYFIWKNKNIYSNKLSIVALHALVCFQEPLERHVFAWRLFSKCKYSFLTGLARRDSTIDFHFLWHTVDLAISTRLCLS